MDLQKAVIVSIILGVIIISIMLALYLPQASLFERSQSTPCLVVASLKGAVINPVRKMIYSIPVVDKAIASVMPINKLNVKDVCKTVAITKVSNISKELYYDIISTYSFFGSGEKDVISDERNTFVTYTFTYQPKENLKLKDVLEEVDDYLNKSKFSGRIGFIKEVDRNGIPYAVPINLSDFTFVKGKKYKFYVIFSDWQMYKEKYVVAPALSKDFITIQEVKEPRDISFNNYFSYLTYKELVSLGKIDNLTEKYGFFSYFNPLATHYDLSKEIFCHSYYSACVKGDISYSLLGNKLGFCLSLYDRCANTIYCSFDKEEVSKLCKEYCEGNKGYSNCITNCKNQDVTVTCEDICNSDRKGFCDELCGLAEDNEMYSKYCNNCDYASCVEGCKFHSYDTCIESCNDQYGISEESMQDALEKCVMNCVKDRLKDCDVKGVCNEVLDRCTNFYVEALIFYSAPILAPIYNILTKNYPPCYLSYDEFLSNCINKTNFYYYTPCGYLPSYLSCCEDKVFVCIKESGSSENGKNHVGVGGSAQME